MFGSHEFTQKHVVKLFWVKKITVEPCTNGHLHDDHLSTTAISFRRTAYT